MWTTDRIECIKQTSSQINAFVFHMNEPVLQSSCLICVCILKSCRLSIRFTFTLPFPRRVFESIVLEEDVASSAHVDTDYNDHK